MGRLRPQRRCRCTVGHHDPLRRGTPQRPRHGVRGARSHPRQGRLGDDLHRPEQRADQPGRILRRPVPRARCSLRRRRLDPRRCRRLSLQPGPDAGQ
ncbi:MAG: hypothetical protein EBY44_03055 [Actinobacteria bacterium]|nr:hypothetical protein [Actinomycetota bacterium]